jgi:hypothetical protein
MGRLALYASLFLLLTSSVSASDKWQDCSVATIFDGGKTISEAKSPTDGLYMQMPDNVAVMESFDVKVYINDPNIRKNANLLEFLCEPGSCAVAAPGKDVDYSSGYPFQNMKYSGEATIDLKVRNAHTDSQKSGINYLALRFIQIKAPLAAGEYDKCNA